MSRPCARGAALLAIVAFAMLVVPVATIGYDGRFGVPAYGVLAAAAVLGVQGLVSRRGAGTSALTPGAADG